MKRFLTVCAVLLLLTAALPASAASGEDCLTLAAAYQGEQIVAAAPAVVCNDDGACTIITDISVHAGGADRYVVILGGRTVEMTYQRDWAEELAGFTADAALLSDYGVLDIARSIQVGEELAYYFYYSGGDDLTVLEGSARVVEENGSHMFNMSLPGDVDQSRITYPAIAVNQAGELAVIETQQTSIPMASIGGGGGDAAPTQAPQNPNPAPTRAPQDPAPESTKRGRDEPDTTPVPSPSSGPDGGLSAGPIVGIAVLAAVAVAVFLRRRNSTGGAKAPVEPVVPPQPISPTQPGPQVPDIPERIEPVELEPQQPRASVLYLCCEGGALDGRRYPVGPSALLIGRDPSCNIRYPADTKGVSRRHCQIFWKNGVLHIMDLGSTSGTFIRGKGQISANAPVAVNAGDTFYLGEKRNGFVIRMGE